MNLSRENSGPLNVQNICLVSVTSLDYWIGTRVMLKSFLRHNKWFCGKIALITDQKEEISKKLIRSGIKADIVVPGDDMKSRIQEVQNRMGGIEFPGRRLYILEIFRLISYERILYFDSDVVHLRELRQEEVLKYDFVAVRDPWHYRGYAREKETMSKIPYSSTTTECLENFFNSGFLSISKKYIHEELYQDLIGKIHVNLYKSLKDNLVDEPVLNIFFSDRVTFAPAGYNCPVHLLIEGIDIPAVRVLHFTGQSKPWFPLSWLRLMIRNPRYLTLLLKWLKFI